jgi:hypothetical protein
MKEEREVNLIDKKDFIIVILVGFMLAVTLYPRITASQSGVAVAGEYDPWVDYNDDGKIDHKDLLQFASVYGTAGDPTKKVEVTNWPVKRQIPLWYEKPMVPDETLWSSIYNASGFGHIHLVMKAWFLTGAEELKIELRSHIRGDGGWIEVVALSTTLTESIYERDITLSVPSETFRFRVYSSPTTTVDSFSMSFYLTWA